ncbi:sodium:proton antiporter [Halioglobus maricola]|uniref:Sodium:proton antiporter n=1 Tax=Halioglobus maricola TaxID=2601894 RepID=A0A5P9NMU9_9GAMM|nr:Na+/H+ antiporter NhaC family protein [Halioglobus maricola]QFU76594.1 sodium:proton antiporter [Halioglobus maricola]
MSKKITNNNDQGSQTSAPLEEAAVTPAQHTETLIESDVRLRPLLKPAGIIFLCSLAISFFVAQTVNPVWVEQKTVFQVYESSNGSLVYTYKGEEVAFTADTVPYAQAELNQQSLDQLVGEPTTRQQWVTEVVSNAGEESVQYAQLEAKYHLGIWSLLPAVLTIALCVLTREPLTALLGGVAVGAFMLGRFDLTGDVLIPSLASPGTASVLLLYLWLLGGLLGIWSKTGAAQAFADYMTKHFVRGPRSAKVVTWCLGVFFFQGGTISTVLVGTTVRPLADRENVSHEEMAYIVDSTASPIASILAFNAWPAYVQALIYVPGVAFLATEADRISFFFKSVPFSFYSIFAVLGTLLLSLGITRFAGGGIRRAQQRAAATGELDAPDATPLAAEELQTSKVPAGYASHVSEFLIPIILIIGTAITTFALTGSPNVHWGFGFALLTAACIALFKGMKLGELVEGLGDGLKGVVVASVILMLAITIGAISKDVGGGLFLVEMLGERIPFWTLPVCLQLLTMAAAFSTGSSWGTYAIVFPLAMPLAWAVAVNQGVSNPELFMTICFVTVLNGSVYGDQCSPISDTTILSSMTTGCDLMDHVKTQLVPATIASAIAAVLWTATVYWFA